MTFEPTHFHAAAAGRGPALRNGLTLIEVVVILAVAGIVLLALALGLHEHARLLQDKLHLQWANLIAEDLMLEIRSRSFTDPQTPATFGPEESPPRANFDDVDDYDGLSDSPPRTIEGAPLTNYDDFTVTAAVENVNPGDLDTETPPADGSTPFKRITVVVQKGKYEVTIVKGKPVVLSVPTLVITNRSVISQYE